MFASIITSSVGWGATVGLVAGCVMTWTRSSGRVGAGADRSQQRQVAGCVGITAGFAVVGLLVGVMISAVVNAL